MYEEAVQEGKHEHAETRQNYAALLSLGAQVPEMMLPTSVEGPAAPQHHLNSLIYSYPVSTFPQSKCRHGLNYAST